MHTMFVFRNQKCKNSNYYLEEGTQGEIISHNILTFRTVCIVSKMIVVNAHLDIKYFNYSNGTLFKRSGKSCNSGEQDFTRIRRTCMVY